MTAEAKAIPSSSTKSTSNVVEIKAEFPKKLKFLSEPYRYKVCYGGRGGTKSWGYARQLLLDGARQPLKVLCTREFQRSIKQSVYRLLCDQIKKLGLSSIYTIKNDTIVAHYEADTNTWGTEFFFEGLFMNVNNIKSYEGIDRVWVEEAANVSKSSWDVLIPTIRKDGSEIWVSFNPVYEDDETYIRFVDNTPTNSFIQQLSWQDNPWWNDILEQERLDHKKRDPDTYNHVWEGECIQWMEGAIYANQLRKAYEEERITEVNWDIHAPVYTAWDIGYTDDTAIWWYQVIRGEIHILECYASNDGDVDEYVSQILGKEVEISIIKYEGVNKIVTQVGENIEGLEHRRMYRYSTHWLPHDARAKTLAAKGKSTIEQVVTALGRDHVRIVPNLSRSDGIKQAKQTFKRCWFDKQGCYEGLRALRSYKREMQRDEKSLQKNPKHDWTSHYADAFRYLGVAWDLPDDVNEYETPDDSIKGLESATLNDLWELKQSIKQNSRI